MGLKDDLLEAQLNASADVGLPQPPDLSDGSYGERLAHYQAEAIVNFMKNSEFTITELKAPVVVETLRTPDQPVNIELETLLGEYQPVLKALKKIGDPLGVGGIIDKLEGEIEKAITPLLQGGAKLAGLDLGKDDGGLDAIGYVYIGEEPDSVDDIDVSDEQGQTTNTTIKFIVENNQDVV
tara:strand:- start:550 stop:1092 length:543 start_codon:yes stop_codon:yes gene_type:complete